jgi:hypothetical protein
MDQNCEQGARIIALPGARRNCDVCSVLYRPLRAHHRICRHCYAWRVAGINIAVAMRALRGAT